MTEWLLQAFIYLFAAVLAVPLAKRLGLGSVLGYLIAGILIGPALGLVGDETQAIQHVAEFGVVMMLFLVGLELEPRALWAMRHKLLGLGGLQVLLTTAAITAVALALGQVWSIALAIGLVFSLSSTAIVLQSLNEKGLMKSDGGQASFSVLLFQDIAVIPMLALIPLLALPELQQATQHGADHHGSLSLVAGLHGWQVAAVTLLAVAAVVVGGHYLSPLLFRFVAQAKAREIFTAAALLLVIGIALLMSLVGLSPALGTFLAGVVLANSEFRHELESDIEPFKGLLLGLFFITVGAGINFGILSANVAMVIGLTVGLIALKAAVLLGLAKVFKLNRADTWLFALALAQAGEFGFVLLAFTVQNSVIPASLADILLLVVAFSMLLTPLLFICYEQLLLPKMASDQNRGASDTPEQGKIIIAGIGRYGQIINRLLLHSGYQTVVLDVSAEAVHRQSKFGVQTFYGDASRPDLLHAAGLEEAQMLIVAIDDQQRTHDIVRHARRHRPDIHIVARAYDRMEVFELYQSGANDIIRETFDSAVRAGRSALEALEIHPFEVEKMVHAFVESDKRGTLELAKIYNPDIPPHENQEYIDLSKKLRKENEASIGRSRANSLGAVDRAWRPPGPVD
ncbi:MAG: monovalent cation:proton antiporter-2 (CPA2) family protein [Granulosicoccaceae bacterium]